MQLVKFDATNLATQLSPIPAGYYVTDDDGPISNGGQRLALVNGAVSRVWDLRGFSCFGGDKGRTPTTVPNTTDMIGKSWDDLAALGYHQVSVPLTADEIAAQQAADAAAAAAAEEQRIANLVVTKYQAKMALLNAGLLDQVEAAIAASTDKAMQLAWADAGTFMRTSPFIASMATAMNLTSAQVDALFVAASQVT